MEILLVSDLLIRGKSAEMRKRIVGGGGGGGGDDDDDDEMGLAYR